MCRRTLVPVLGLLVLAAAGYLVYRSVSGKARPEPPKPVAAGDELLPAIYEPLPTIVVEAAYPGANARVVADTVAAPVEQQVSGVEGLLRMRSQSASDGTYTLTLTFTRGTDPNLAQVLVQNRLALAQPLLPAVVNRSGLTVRKELPGAHLIATLSAPGGRLDQRYLGNYADTQLKDELERLAGVARVRLVGLPDKGFATLGGKPVVALVLSRLPGAAPRDVSDAVRARLTELRAKLPEGLALDLFFDAAPGPDAA